MKIGGYTGKYIDADLSTYTIKIKNMEKKEIFNFLGGRGLATWFLWKELGNQWEKIDPLSSDNLFILMSGPLTGYYPGMKVCISGKSPLSNGVIGSTVSSEIGLELKAAGYDGIIIRGKSERPIYLLVHNEHVELRDASHLWGLKGQETAIKLMKETYSLVCQREKNKGLPREPAMVYIGPAGEKVSRMAAVMAKWTHAAGYGGYGAVMGSKKLKAIVVKGEGPLPPVSSPARLKDLLKSVWRKLFSNTRMRVIGTSGSGYRVATISAEPVKNWQEEWHDNREIGVATFISRTWIKDMWGDYGCPLTCMKVAAIRYGPRKGAKTDGPDYELEAYLGTNLGIFKPEDIVYLSHLADEYGFDGINLGNTLGFVAELYQRGYLSREELGFDLRWGDTDAFARLIKLIADRAKLGDILAEGTYRAALLLSKKKNTDLLRYAIQVKGIGVGAHGVRSGKDFVGPISYAVSVQGGDHTSVAQEPARSMNGELFYAFLDSAVICMFTTFGIEMSTLIDFTNAVTGLNFTVEQWFNETGLRIIHLQRALLLLGGPDVKWNPEKDDDNPPRFYEPLPTGPCKGKTLSRDDVKTRIKEYYKQIGYDQRGIPKKEVLISLGLDDVARKLEKTFGY